MKRQPDFTLLSAKQRRLLDLRVDGYGPKGIAYNLDEDYKTIMSRQAWIVQKMGLPIEELTKAWRKYPYRKNTILWDVVDTIRQEIRRCR